MSLGALRAIALGCAMLATRPSAAVLTPRLLGARTARSCAVDLGRTVVKTGLLSWLSGLARLPSGLGEAAE